MMTGKLFTLLLASAAVAYVSAKGCTAVTRANCGTDWSNNCLKCGSG